MFGILKRVLLGAVAVAVAIQLWFFAQVIWFAFVDPSSTAFMMPNSNDCGSRIRRFSSNGSGCLTSAFRCTSSAR